MGSLITANGIDVIELASNVPRIGVWGFELVVDSETALTGPVTVSIADGALVYSGTAYPARSGEYIQVDHTRVIAGQGGLSKLATPKMYRQVPLRLVLGDLLKAAGETLSGTTDSGVLNTQLDFWTVVQQTASSAIVSLLSACQTVPSWRMLPDGSFWAGYESWPQVSLDYQLLASVPREGRLEIGTDNPIVQPGYALSGGDADGTRIDYVETRITGDKIRQALWVP